MDDYEIRRLQDQIRELERKVDNLDYDLRQAKDELRAELRHKANIVKE